MKAQAMQAELQEVINLMKQVENYNDMPPLKTAVDKLTKLKKDISSVPNLGGNPGGPGGFHRDGED